MTGRATWSFVLVAAGSGNRVGGMPKQFRKLGRYPMWKWGARVAETLFSNGMIEELIVVFPRDHDAADEEIFAVPTRYICGGSTRTESVRHALDESEADFVMIHDAARPFLSVELCEELIDKVLRESGAGAVPLLESVDSLKFVGDSISALQREKIFRTQTPQAFGRETLKEAMSSCLCGATDEATLWIESGQKLVYVRGSEKNFKITTEFDWLVAKSLIEAGRTFRVGIGYDVHELAPGRNLILGGVRLESPLGLVGHSDADIICHAVSDALLGASGEGDIGTMFPASDLRYKDADSMAMLKRVLDLTVRNGWSVVNVDVALMAQIPRMGDKIAIIADNLRRLITPICPYAKINVKVKSGEQVGSVGRGECMKCFAAAEIEKYGFGGD